MRTPRLFLGLLLVSGVPALAPEHEGSASGSPKYIIEYERGSLAKRHEEISNIEGINLERSFDSDIFSGFAISVDDLSIDALEALPGVQRVWPNRYIPPPVYEEFDSVEAAGDSTLRSIPHNSTGVSRLHELGIYGKGVKVCVVDTGIYYNHSALGGGFGPGYKVAGGWDIVGDGDWPKSPMVPDSDPNDTSGHGTHVAGIIAGNSNILQGVAPEATLWAYKVFTKKSGTQDDAILAAFLRAENDNCDIVTASIGGTGGFSDNVWAQAASKLVEKGIFVSISAGNSGDNGPFYPSNGSSGKNVVAVASIETEKVLMNPFDATFKTSSSSNTVRLGYLYGEGDFSTSGKGAPIKPVSLDTTVKDDACNPLPLDANFKGAIALVRRGNCSFQQKWSNLKDRGAEYILVYSDERPLLPISLKYNKPAIAMITAESGEAITKAVAAGGNVYADFYVNSEELIPVPHLAAGKPAITTSWGGTWDLDLKPNIAAPGGVIFSTWNDGGYKVASGTSMACPYVAGVAALWISQNGGRLKHGNGFAKKLGQRIISSGNAVSWYDGRTASSDFDAPVVQVGNGLIDAWKVLQYDTRLEFDPFALNDTRNFNPDHEISIFNQGREEVSYTWSVEYTAGIEAIGWLPNDKGVSRRIKKFNQLEPQKLEAQVGLPSSFTLGPGQSRKVTVRFSNPEGITPAWNASGLPVYGGRVSLAGSNGEHLSVPFFGVGADLKAQLTPMVENGYPIAVSGPSNVTIMSDSSYSFDLSLDKQDYPRIYTKLLWGTRQIRWDIFEAGWQEGEWNYPPVVGQNKYVGSVVAFQADDDAVYDPQKHQNYAMYPFPFYERSRTRDPAVPDSGFDKHYFAWLGKLANGTHIAKGKYEMRFAALKPFGKPEQTDDWEVYQTPQIQVV